MSNPDILDRYETILLGRLAEAGGDLDVAQAAMAIARKAVSVDKISALLSLTSSDPIEEVFEDEDEDSFFDLERVLSIFDSAPRQKAVARHILTLPRGTEFCARQVMESCNVPRGSNRIFTDTIKRLEENGYVTSVGERNVGLGRNPNFWVTTV